MKTFFEGFRDKIEKELEKVSGEGQPLFDEPKSRLQIEAQEIANAFLQLPNADTFQKLLLFVGRHDGDTYQRLEGALKLLVDLFEGNEQILNMLEEGRRRHKEGYL